MLTETRTKLTKIALTFAAYDGTERGMKLMLDDGADPNALLVQAAPRHNILEILIDAGADVNQERKVWHHNTALFSSMSQSCQLSGPAAPGRS